MTDLTNISERDVIGAGFRDEDKARYLFHIWRVDAGYIHARVLRGPWLHGDTLRFDRRTGRCEPANVEIKYHGIPPSNIVHDYDLILRWMDGKLSDAA